MFSLVLSCLLAFQQGGYTYPSEHAIFRPAEVFVLGMEMPSATPKTKAPPPPKVQPVQPKPIRIEIKEEKLPFVKVEEVKKVEEVVYFDLNSFKIREKEKGKLDKLPRDLMYEITGYTCDLGTKEYNDHLALKRAESVKEYLGVKGKVSGKGKCCYTDPKDRGKNRRVEINSK